jgi:hypothetical protein
MSENDIIFWFASVGLPAIIVTGGYIILKLHERSLKR